MAADKRRWKTASFSFFSFHSVPWSGQETWLCSSLDHVGYEHSRLLRMTILWRGQPSSQKLMTRKLTASVLL